MNSIKKFLLLLIAISFIGAGCSSASVSVGDKKELADAPNFKLSDYNGNIIEMSQFKGTPLVINSWAAWCIFCKKELIDFATAQKEFGDRVKFIAIDRAESLGKIKKYTDDLDITDKMIFLLDPKDSFYKSIGGFAMPETIFVNSDGKIEIHKRGPMGLEEIRNKVNDLLNNK